MPLWNVYCPEGTYTAGEKQAFAERVTDLYAKYGLPRFYVIVVFQELSEESFFMGGERAGDFVRIWIDEIARSVPDELRGWWMKQISETVSPFATERGLRWEVHVDDTPRQLWSINGLKPPEEGSEEERRWARENKPSAPAKSAP